MPHLVPLFIAPLLFILLAFLAHSGMENRTWKLFTSSFFFGIIASLPMIIAVFVVKEYWLGPALSLRRILFFSFALIGFLSETFKFIFLRFKFIPSEEVTKPFDGILYSIVISLGYATAANIFFFYYWDFTENQDIVLYTLPFANLLMGIILGFFTGMSKFRTSNSIDALTGLAAAIFFQGFYNFCLYSEDYLLLGLVAFGTLIISIMLAAKSLNTNVNSMI